MTPDPTPATTPAVPSEEPLTIDQLVMRAESNWCAATHHHGMSSEQIGAIRELAKLARSAPAAAATALTFARLREVSVARAEIWHNGKPWSLSDWATATTGELGETCNIIKKLNRIRDGLTGNDVDEATLRANLADELADTAIYLDLLANAAGVDLATAIVRKFNATSEKNGFPERL